MAVFLALGLGVLVGTTVLNDPLVTGLRRRTDELQRSQDELRQQLDGALQDVAQLERFADDVEASALADRLALRSVVIVTADGVGADAVDEAVAALDRSGARIVATITAQPSMAAANTSDAAALAEAIGAPADTAPATLMADAADALAARLASPPVRPGDGQSDVLARLLNGGLVVAPGLSDAGLADVGGSTQAVVTVGGGEAQDTSEGFLVPLTAGLVDREVLTVAAESSDPDASFVTDVRDRSDSPALITVDGLDHPIGATALVLAIDGADLSGEGGAYGYGDQAPQVLPPPPE